MRFLIYALVGFLQLGFSNTAYGQYSGNVSLYAEKPSSAPVILQGSAAITDRSENANYRASAQYDNPPGLALQAQTQYQPSCIGIHFQPDGWGHSMVTFVCDRSDVYGKILPGDICISENGMSVAQYEQSEQLVQDCGSKVEIIYFSVQNNQTMSLIAERHPLSWFPAWFSQAVRAKR